MDSLLNTMDLVILGCSQNCGRYLHHVCQNIRALGLHFRSHQVLLLENDSQDNTIDEIRNSQYLFRNLTARSFSGLNAKIPIRTERLAHLRNCAMDWVRQRQLPTQQTLVMVIDMDEVNAMPWRVDEWIQPLSWFINKRDAAAMFANQKGPYYDLWALRHPRRCPTDVWLEVINLHLEKPFLSDEGLIQQAYLPWQFTIDPDGPAEKVDSAFGGLGFYKLSWLQQCQTSYSGLISKWLDRPGQPSKLIRWQVAEHVSLHAGLRAAGASLWIHPRLINWHTDQLPSLRPNPQAWRHLSV